MAILIPSDNFFYGISATVFGFTLSMHSFRLLSNVSVFFLCAIGVIIAWIPWFLDNFVEEEENNNGDM